MSKLKFEVKNPSNKMLWGPAVQMKYIVMDNAITAPLKEFINSKRDLQLVFLMCLCKYFLCDLKKLTGLFHYLNFIPVGKPNASISKSFQSL